MKSPDTYSVQFWGEGWFSEKLKIGSPEDARKHIFNNIHKLKSNVAIIYKNGLPITKVTNANGLLNIVSIDDIDEIKEIQRLNVR